MAAYFQFPTRPYVGQTYSYQGRVWEWSGYSWNITLIEDAPGPTLSEQAEELAVLPAFTTKFAKIPTMAGEPGQALVATSFTPLTFGWSNILANQPGATGPSGPAGINGTTGPSGVAGSNGVTGPTGSSAYDLAVLNGFSGSSSDWLASLVGSTGATGVGGAGGGGSSRFVPLIVFNGESNSGGQAPNASASAPELAPRSSVQILNNTTFLFEDLDVGTNNNIDHYNLPPFVYHGWEIGLANSVESNLWLENQIYLVKTGQGGSQLSQWGVGSTFYTKFYDRVSSAINLITASGKIPLIYMWWTFGINDAIAGTNQATWMTGCKALHARMRDDFGYFPIFSPRIMAGSPGEPYNTSIDAYAASDPMFFTVPSTGATQNDSNHWDYAGMKLLATRLGTATRAFGQHEAYLVRQISALAGSAPVLPEAPTTPGLTITPGSLSFVEGVGGNIQVKLTSQPSSTVTVDVAISGGNATRTPTSLTFTTGNWNTNQQVSVASADDGTASGARSAVIALTSTGISAPGSVNVAIYDADAPVPVLTAMNWKDFVNSSQVGSELHFAGALGGANAIGTIDATQPFRIVYEWLDADTSALILYLDDSTPNTTFLQADPFVTGFYQYSPSVHVVASGGQANAIGGWAVTAPQMIALEKSGNDVIYSISTNSGATFTQKYVHTGVLAGKTTLYPRALTAIPTSPKVKLYYDAAVFTPGGLVVLNTPANTATPVISGTTAVGDVLTTTSGTWTNTPSSYTYQWKRNGTNISGATSTTYTLQNADMATSLTCQVTAVNGDGSNYISSNQIYVPNPNAGSLTPVTWGSFQGTTSPVAGTLAFANGSVAGGKAVETIDATQAFKLQITHSSTSLDSQALVVFLSANSISDYAWPQGYMTVGVYHFNGSHTIEHSGQAYVTMGTTAFPVILQLEKSGNDVVVTKSTDGGTTWSSFYTDTGVLAGKTTLYVKALFAVPTAGQKINVQLQQ